MALPTCPYCGAKLFPHELTNGECSSCERRLPANITADAPPEPDRRGGRDRDADPFLRRDAGAPYDSYDRPSGTGYGMVRVGVNMIRWGMGFLLFLVALGVVWGIVFAASGFGRRFGGGPIDQLIPLVVMFGLAEIALGLVIFLGFCFCCTVPVASEGAGWARGLIVCLALVVLFGILFLVIDFSMTARSFAYSPVNDMGAAMLFVGMGLVLSAFGQELCFFMTLRGVARDFGDYKLGGRLLAFFVTSIILPIVGLIFFTAVMVETGPQPVFGDAAAVFAIAYGVVLLTVVFLAAWLLALLGRLNQVMGSGASDRYSYGGR